MKFVGNSRPVLHGFKKVEKYIQYHNLLPSTLHMLDLLELTAHTLMPLKQLHFFYSSTLKSILSSVVFCFFIGKKLPEKIISCSNLEKAMALPSKG